MLTIRLQRIGKKGQPSYRLVVAERRSKVGAPPTEDLGAYNPFTKQASFKADRVNHWIGVGASPTITVHNLLVKNGVIDAPKRRVHIKQAVAKVAEPEAEAPAAKSDEAPAEAKAEVVAEEVPAEPVKEETQEPVPAEAAG